MQAETSSPSSRETGNSGGPRVQFARYVDGRLQLFTARTSELDYYAVSHVWGEIQWLSVRGVDHEILVSRQKATFIENTLPSLVGTAAFWMDTLTVNQRDQAEVIATVQAIPATFRDAVKTIAVRQGDGFYNCCLKAVKDFTEWEDFAQKMALHSFAHCDDVYRESYLQRLWTLQECFLSHTIQFVEGDESKVALASKCETSNKALDELQKKAESNRLDVYAERTATLWATDSLYALAQAFNPPNIRGSSPISGLEDFMQAYLFSGTITREKPAPRGLDEDIYSGHFREMQLYSNRSATEPRDYIFATMPQFPWYHYPADAEVMSFNAIFEDFYQQAKRAGHAFACRITRSMIESAQYRTAEQAWYPSGQQPEPETLGDFFKLLGQRIHIAEDNSNYHLTTIVKLAEVKVKDIAGTLGLLDSAMRFSSRKWHQCHKGGELANYGSWPEVESSRLGMARVHLEMCEEEAPSLEREAEMSRLRAEIAEEEAREPHYDLLEEARKTLDIIWATIDPYIQDAGMQSDGYYIKQKLKRYYHPKLMEFLVLLTAMVSCQVPLSAAIWARKYFIPVRVDYKKFHVIGLLAKHAIASDISSG
jgi:hypothetical protein